MSEITIGAVAYRILCMPRDDQWIARAERVDNGDRFGIECSGATEPEAVGRLRCWLEWQRDHTEALAALQLAERAYHRTIAGSAFASPTEGPSPVEMQKEALGEVESARAHLDEVRARKPM